MAEGAKIIGVKGRSMRLQGSSRCEGHWNRAEVLRLADWNSANSGFRKRKVG